MQTQISDTYRNTEIGRRADSILRKCVHCGFCTATCPTYQILGDELDSPRGRIYLIKQMLEGKQVSRKTQKHLDRCLTCRSCETTCPSGVEYSKLVDIGRHLIEQQVSRPWYEKLARALLRYVIPNRQRFTLLLSLAQWPRSILPATLKRKIPSMPGATLSIPVSSAPATRRMLLLESCGQSSATPDTNLAAKIVLQKLGIYLYSSDSAGCCGALSHHLSAEDEALDYIRNNIDAWWPHVEAGVESIIITASGCGAMVKDYGYLMAHDQNYAEKAQRISLLAKDFSEVLYNEDLSAFAEQNRGMKVAFHSPCTLQHGQSITNIIETILGNAGYQLTAVADSHLCCGSAGTYSYLQPVLSQRLLDNKLKSLQANQPELIVTANIGCQMHLQSKASIPVKHWIELLV